MDLSAAQPRPLTPAGTLAAQAALLVAMGCGDACPYIHSVQREDWNLPDPKGQPPEPVRAIRDDSRERVGRLIATRGWRTAEG